MARVLLIEDDVPVARAVVLGLQRLGHQVRHELDGMADVEVLLGDCEVVVLDVGLPGDDGFAVCRRIRAVSDRPVVMLTARSDDIDTVVGLESGADDYVIKPTSPRVLDARIKAMLRRAESRPREVDDSIDIGELTVDRSALQVYKRGVLVTMSPTELRLLLALSENVGRVLSREQLLGAVWDHQYLGDSRLVDTAVQRLRAKIEDDPAKPALIETVRGFGYRLTRPKAR